MKIALEAGALKLGRVALDGSKVKANASKHKAMSYERMKEQEETIRQQVEEMLAQAEATDAAEDAQYGKNQRGDELPAELQRRQSRLARIQQAKQAIEQRAREKAAQEDKPPEQAQPRGKDQYNFSDPESRIMKSTEGFAQACNAQLAVEGELQLIVGQAVTQAANDKQQLEPMVQTIEAQAGQRPQQILADSGYYSEQSLEFLEKRPKGRSRATLRRNGRSMGRNRWRRGVRCRKMRRGWMG